MRSLDGDGHPDWLEFRRRADAVVYHLRAPHGDHELLRDGVKFACLAQEEGRGRGWQVSFETCRVEGSGAESGASVRNG